MAPIDEMGFHTIEIPLRQALLDAFADHHPRTDVSASDYVTFFEIKTHNDEGQDLSKFEMSALQKIAERSPAFLEAPLLEADVLAKNGDKRAFQLARNAQVLAPADPRPLQSEFWIDLHNHKFPDAQRILTRLTKLRPDNPQIPLLQARLESDPAQAYNDWKEAVGYIPSWRNLLGMAKVEEELGMVSEARDHLDQILADSPSNVYAQQQLAELELYYGDPARAEKVYLDLIKTSRNSRFYSNLGAARVLLNHYNEAAESFHEALNLEPGNDGISLNLGDTELALGHKSAAEALYKKILRNRRTNHLKGANDDDYDMVEAQCLAHLGYLEEALKIAQSALNRNLDDPGTNISAALVFTLAGKYGPATATIRDALAKHLDAHWFKLPSFAPLFKDPTFQRLMNGASAG
jgi:tetratricopeptide (TPR) repeat protein